VNRVGPRTVRTVLIAAAVVGVLAAACTSTAPPDGAAGPSTTAMTVPGSIAEHTGPRELLDGFEEITITVTAADGSEQEWCLLLAATPEARERGLMFVTDPALGGYDGMLFQFDEEGTGGFWMKNTRLPLSIAYLDGDGAIVSTADMEPCPDGTERCPGYPPDGPYRAAIEVVQGRLDDLGLEGEARVTTGERSCPPVGAAAT
jgi:uncharacterized membrane protein (UPF0127 family)